jgi:hypothetical protein
VTSKTQLIPSIPPNLSGNSLTAALNATIRCINLALAAFTPGSTGVTPENTVTTTTSASGVLVMQLTITAPITITPPAPTQGALLFVYGVMDSTGHAVTWAASVQWPPQIDTTTTVGFAALFVGVGSVWVPVGIPIIGASL